MLAERLLSAEGGAPASTQRHPPNAMCSARGRPGCFTQRQRHPPNALWPNAVAAAVGTQRHRPLGPTPPPSRPAQCHRHDSLTPPRRRWLAGGDPADLPNALWPTPPRCRPTPLPYGPNALTAPGGDPAVYPTPVPNANALADRTQRTEGDPAGPTPSDPMLPRCRHHRDPTPAPGVPTSPPLAAHGATRLSDPTPPRCRPTPYPTPTPSRPNAIRPTPSPSAHPTPCRRRRLPRGRPGCCPTPSGPNANAHTSPPLPWPTHGHHCPQRRPGSTLCTRNPSKGHGCRRRCT